jgi:hypothetical protein
MNVFVCYEKYYDYCNHWETLIHIFANELDAMSWVCEVEATNTEWRAYEEVEVK